MGTLVSIEVDAPDAAVERAFEWFRLVEASLFPLRCGERAAPIDGRQVHPGESDSI